MRVRPLATTPRRPARGRHQTRRCRHGDEEEEGAEGGRPRPGQLPRQVVKRMKINGVVEKEKKKRGAT